MNECYSWIISIINMYSVRSGVPQGSVLGPVLFILYVNDIAGCVAVTVSIKLFADDAKIYIVISDGNSTQLQSSLDALVSWADHRQLKLSPIKCRVNTHQVTENYASMRLNEYLGHNFGNSAVGL
jgi:Reverse transcriptase (RNA-dependent DNA polymerase)